MRQTLHYKGGYIHVSYDEDGTERVYYCCTPGGHTAPARSVRAAKSRITQYLTARALNPHKWGAK